MSQEKISEFRGQRTITPTLWILTLVSAGFLGYLKVSDRNERRIDENALQAGVRERPITSEMSLRPAPGRTNRQTFGRLHPVEAASSEGRYFQPELMRSNPVYVARVVKHLDLNYYHSSPAKDTPECEQIRELLEREGVGLEAVGDAYNAAYDNARHLAAGTDAQKLPEAEVLAKMFRDNAEYRLRVKYGLTNRAFFDDLFQIKPHRFFGSKNRHLPSAGELLLD